MIVDMVDKYKRYISDSWNVCVIKILYPNYRYRPFYIHQHCVNDLRLWVFVHDVFISRKKSCFITLYTCSWEQCFITRGKYTEKDSHALKISQWEQIIYSENRDALGRINYQDNLLRNWLVVKVNDICKTYLTDSTDCEFTFCIYRRITYIQKIKGT